jgi:hypothetical protein
MLADFALVSGCVAGSMGIDCATASQLARVLVPLFFYLQRAGLIRDGGGLSLSPELLMSFARL